MTDLKSNSKLGCLPTGCFVAIVMAIVVAIILLLIVRYGIRRAYNEFATDTKITFAEPPSTISEEAKRSFSKLKDNCKNEILSFTADEINFFVAHDDFFSSVKGLATFDIKDSEVIGKFSVPLDSLSDIPSYSWLGLDLHGKYLNGQAVGSPIYNNSQFLLRVKSLQLNNREAPEEGRMAAESWILGSPLVPSIKIEELKVDDGKLVITCSKK